MKSHHVIERLEKVKSEMIVKKYVIRKEVKSINEEETKKKVIMTLNLKNKTGKSDVECVCKDGCKSELSSNGAVHYILCP